MLTSGLYMNLCVYIHEYRHTHTKHASVPKDPHISLWSSINCLVLYSMSRSVQWPWAFLKFQVFLHLSPYRGGRGWCVSPWFSDH